jgi:hypothetical protein
MNHRVDVLGAVDRMLGTTSFRGSVVRNRRGVHTDADGIEDGDSVLDALEHRTPGGDDVCSAHKHGRLRGQQRCPGCGRTKNEVEIDRG